MAVGGLLKAVNGVLLGMGEAGDDVVARQKFLDLVMAFLGGWNEIMRWKLNGS
jgi:hypothetical protein